MMSSRSLFLSFLVITSPAFACDPCALFNASRLEGHSAGSFNFSISEQYTNYNRAQDFSDEDFQEGELVRGFSTTQFALGYDMSDEFGIQLTLPFLGRRFDDVTDSGSSTESDTGLGDLTLSGTYSFVNCKYADYTIIAGVTGGVKFPTGETGTLREVASEELGEEDQHHGDDAENDKMIVKHHQIASGSGGRALVFGTGSYDFIMGLNFLGRYQRFLMISSAQYTARTEGDFDYEFANDFLFSVGPGYYLSLSDSFSLAGLVLFSGEFKGKDHRDGELVTGSAVSNLYLGPELLLTTSSNLSAELGFDFRVTGEDVDSTVVPETRLRASVSYRFS